MTVLPYANVCCPMCIHKIYLAYILCLHSLLITNSLVSISILVTWYCSRDIFSSVIYSTISFIWLANQFCLKQRFMSLCACMFGVYVIFFFLQPITPLYKSHISITISLDTLPSISICFSLPLYFYFGYKLNCHNINTRTIRALFL